ncbi:MAG: Rpn family recombination-promoting nuclease/putative transposase [Muribaculaceae bacterium]|nr:Rpn family recombination-promoting nuclease/putative transposase [Muribaculaceae bacterium]
MGEFPRYMNLMTDYAFKKVYGSPEHKNNLITLLNAALEGKEKITDIEYLDKEQLPFREDHKRVVFDIYCTTSDGSHVIVEMQRTIQPTFSDRAIAYCTHAILNQIIRGKKYSFSKVYGIYLMDFHLLGHTPKVMRRVTLMDEDSHQPFSDKMNLEPVY